MYADTCLELRRCREGSQESPRFLSWIRHEHTRTYVPISANPSSTAIIRTNMSNEFYITVNNNTEFVCINQALNIQQVTEQCTVHINNELDPFYNTSLCGDRYFTLRTKLSVPQEQALTVAVTESMSPTSLSTVHTVSSVSPKGKILSLSSDSIINYYQLAYYKSTQSSKQLNDIL